MKLNLKSREAENLAAAVKVQDIINGDALSAGASESFSCQDVENTCR